MPRTLSYLLSGNPMNTNDLKDLVRKGKSVTNVRVKLKDKIEDYVSENVILTLKKLISHYSGEIDGKRFEFDVRCGWCVAGESIEKQRACINASNRRVAYHQERLKGIGIKLDGEELRFDDSYLLI